ncbi:hypothetical protein NKJ70_05875 [Mesorhizobium sp. M0092]|uniref:hypothetical protein n=1 Tax=Mesorhizobium sp. M0092 TaxID=2956876 RepID=UPI0033356575
MSAEKGGKANPIAFNFEELIQRLEDVQRKTHAGFVLAATQILANELEILLVSHMPGINQAMYKRLFFGFGPMASLSSKIYFAEAFGIISEPLAVELHKLREIRNLFAHTIKTLDFKNAKVRTLTAKLEFPDDGKKDLSERYFVAATADAIRALTKLEKPIPEWVEKFLKNRSGTLGD